MEMGRRFRVWLFAVGAMLAGAAPALGATMPPSRAMSVLTSASEPTLTNETVAGANVFTFLATPTSANLASAVTGETGTGGVVFAVGPILSAPELNSVIVSGGSADGLIIGGTTPAAGSFTTINGTTPSTFGRSLWDDADATAGRSTLGLGSIATQAASSVSITGGSITGITDLAVADGGTGASSFTSGAILKGAGTSAITTATAGSDYSDPGTFRVLHKDGTENTYQASADTDAARGTALRTACDAMVAYDVLYLPAAVCDLGVNALRGSQFPSNVAIVGAGVNATEIKSQLTSATGLIVTPGSNNVFSDLTFNGSLTNGSFQLVFGNNSSTAAAASGVVCRNVRILGDSDGVYAVHATNALAATFVNCTIATQYDAVVQQGAAHSLTFFDCVISTAGGSTGATAGYSRSIVHSAGTLNVFGGTIDSTLATTPQFSAEVYGISTAATCNVYGAKITTTNSYSVGNSSPINALSGATVTAVGNTLSASGSCDTIAGVYCSSGATATVAGGLVTKSGTGAKCFNRAGGTLTVYPNCSFDNTATTGTVTYAPLVTSQANVTAAANSSAIVSTGYSLTGSNAQSLVDLTGTWNTSGNPVAIFANVTNTASGATARLMDLKVNGSTVFAIEKSGTATIGGGQIKDSGSGQLGIGGSIGENYYASANFFQVTGSKALSFGVNYGTSDVFVYRDAANVLAQRNGANGQEMRIYGADGASTADEYVSVAATTSGDTIEAAKAATGTYRDLTIKSGGVSTLKSTSAGELTALVGLNYPVANKTSTFTATAAERTFFCDATGGAITANLPAAASYTGRVYIIVKTDSSGNAVTIDPNASETLNGSTTQAISTQYGVWQIQSNGTNWFKIN